MMAALDVTLAEPPPLRLDAHGVVRVGGTRVTLDTVVDAYEAGESAEEIAENYDVLSLATVYATIAFYLRHEAEVREYLSERERQAEAARRMSESRSPQHGLRERLLARQRKAA